MAAATRVRNLGARGALRCLAARSALEYGQDSRKFPRSGLCRRASLVNSCHESALRTALARDRTRCLAAPGPLTDRLSVCRQGCRADLDDRWCRRSRVTSVRPAKGRRGCVAPLTMPEAQATARTASQLAVGVRIYCSKLNRHKPVGVQFSMCGSAVHACC